MSCVTSQKLLQMVNPLMIRISKDGEKKYSSLDISAHPIHGVLYKKVNLNVLVLIKHR